MPIKRSLTAVSVALALVAGGAALAQVKPRPAAPTTDLLLWRLDCGTIQVKDLSLFSDTEDYRGRTMAMPASCYLIRHGTEYLLWDTGLPQSADGSSTEPLVPVLGRTLNSQLAIIGVRPEEIRRIGISHYHFDHMGQAAAFPNAVLMIGAKDWEALQMPEAPFGSDPTLVAPWLKGERQVDLVSGDRDVFGDGSVIMLTAPGHTPGSSALLVRLPKTGPVILSGDIVHFHEQLDVRGAPPWNTDRAQSLASMERLERLATNLRAKLEIQHDPDDVARLPSFPEAAN